MRNIFYSVCVCLAALYLSACDDFLTVSSPDQLTSDSFWRDETDAQNALASAYSQLYHGDPWDTSERRWPVEAYRDDLYELGYDAANYEAWVQLYNFTYTNGNSSFTYYYEDLYRGISFANQIIEKVTEIPSENITESARQQIINEAYFLRGYYHMMLLLNWEKIVIRDKYITDQSDLDKSLSERTEAWDFIISDLQKATALPASYSANNIGRATCGAAYSYLGFAYLTRAYEESGSKDSYLSSALAALNSVTGYELVSGDALINMFNGTNKNCSESIFEIQYSGSTDNGARYYSYMSTFIASEELGGWDEIIPNNFLFNEFKKEGMIATTGKYDTRMYNTLYFDGGEKIFGVYDYDELFSSDRPVFRKLTPLNEDEVELECDFNLPLMRYANVLLMKAEVLNEQGNPSQAIPLINEIRATHGDMPAMTGTTQAEVREQIEHERIIEFPLENLRWYDLRRWGKLSEAMANVNKTSYKAGTNDFYPTPLREINANSLVSQ